MLPRCAVWLSLLSLAAACNHPGVAHYVVPEGTTSIEQQEFIGCYALKTVVLPKNLERIEAQAFSRTGLEAIDIPDSVTFIGKWAFAFSRSLKTVVLPKNLESIEALAFRSTGLEAIDIPDSVTVISEAAFAYSRSLKTVVLPKNLESIEAYAFGRTGLEAIDIPDSVTGISEYAFAFVQLSCVTMPVVAAGDIDSSTFYNAGTDTITLHLNKNAEKLNTAGYMHTDRLGFTADIILASDVCMTEKCCAAPEVPRAACSAYECPADYVDAEGKDSKLCKGAACAIDDKNTCCSPREACSAYECPADHVHVADKDSKLCKGAACAMDDKNTCCEPREPCLAYECPATLADAADKDSIVCQGAECTNDECCVRHPFCVAPPLNHAVVVFGPTPWKKTAQHRAAYKTDSKMFGMPGAAFVRGIAVNGDAQFPDFSIDVRGTSAVTGTVSGRASFRGGLLTAQEDFESRYSQGRWIAYVADLKEASEHGDSVVNARVEFYEPKGVQVVLRNDSPDMVRPEEQVLHVVIGPGTVVADQSSGKVDGAIIAPEADVRINRQWLHAHGFIVARSLREWYPRKGGNSGLEIHGQKPVGIECEYAPGN